MRMFCFLRFPKSGYSETIGEALLNRSYDGHISFNIEPNINSQPNLLQPGSHPLTGGRPLALSSWHRESNRGEGSSLRQKRPWS